MNFFILYANIVCNNKTSIFPVLSFLMWFFLNILIRLNLTIRKR